MTGAQKTKLVALAKGLVGRPYKYGAAPEEAPNFFDCSSFVQYVFKQIGIELPRSSILQAADPQGKEIALAHDFSNLETGDVLFARGRKGHYDDDLFGGRQMTIGHVGLYLGNGEIIHSRHKLGGVTIQGLTVFTAEPHDHIVMVKRF
ncbi:MAG: NlpC/P60 family protein [Candidatus Jorgensenbacteria bacterium]